MKDFYPHEVDAEWVRAEVIKYMNKSMEKTMELFEEIRKAQEEPKSPERDFKIRLLKMLLNSVYR